MKRGNCYVTSEALYHLLGGKQTGWKPCIVYVKNRSHWFLRHSCGIILDATVSQFGGTLPDYDAARGSGFLTKSPSKRAKALMEKLVWSEVNVRHR